MLSPSIHRTCLGHPGMKGESGIDGSPGVDGRDGDPGQRGKQLAHHKTAFTKINSVKDSTLCQPS